MKNEKLKPCPCCGKEFKQYRRKQIAELRPYEEGEELPISVSISQADKDNGSPKVGDMIARNPKNHNNQWLIAKQYFEDNFEPIELWNTRHYSVPTNEEIENKILELTDKWYEEQAIPHDFENMGIAVANWLIEYLKAK